MSSSGWALIQYDRCPYRKGKFGHRLALRRLCEDERRDLVISVQVKEGSRLPALHQKLGEAGTDFPSQPLAASGPADTLI